MHWIARLNCGAATFAFPGATVEVTHWAYSTQLPDNVPHRHTCFEVCLVGDWGAGLFTVLIYFPLAYLLLPKDDRDPILDRVRGVAQRIGLA